MDERTRALVEQAFEAGWDAQSRAAHPENDEQMEYEDYLEEYLTRTAMTMVRKRLFR